MNGDRLQQLLQTQRAYFDQGRTLPLAARRQALSRLKAVLLRREQDIYAALSQDLGKSPTESYMCELGMVLSELSYMQKHLGRLAREKRVSTPLAQFPAKSYVKPCPRGVTLIMSPWNYPLMLTLDPLVDAIAAGNTAILKPSAYAPASSELLAQIVEEAFDPGLAAVVTGGRAENQQLLGQKFDYIFFTGSTAVGKEVLKAAAPNLTPVSLELGGKSPCIVDETADIALAARRIVFGKFLNCGQTCVAPDYVVCRRSLYAPLMAALRKEIRRQLGEDPLKNPDYGKIISRKHYDRLLGLLKASQVSYGGETREAELKIAPALISPCTWEEPIMEEEIFGPLLPVLSYEDLDSLLELINSRPHPLALYFFSRNKAAIRKVTALCPFGGGCINDTIIHLATTRMGFGGVGHSGMGAYHGKEGFRAFSHDKSMVDKKLWLDLPMRYQPYTNFHDRLIRMFLK